MLREYQSLKDFPFSAVMSIYEETNRKTGKSRYPDEPPERQVALAEGELYNYLRDVFFSQPVAKYYLWLVGDRPVSALRIEPYRDGFLVSAMETAPESRSHGYAKALLQAVIHGMVPVRLYSHIHHRNAASIAVHTACGFRKIRDCAVTLDGTFTSKMGTYFLEIQ